MAGLCAPLPTLRRHPRGCQRTARGQCGLLLLHCSGLTPPTLCRFLPAHQKSFPPYAYLPGKKPHPVRDPTGHSYHVEPIPVAAEASLDSDAFLWGLDLFNHGYYWEAHEAWEGLWQVADRDGPLRMLL